MPQIIIFSILIVGLSGMVTQVVLLRELLLGFYGNELTLGVILANWILAEALGAFIIGKLIDKTTRKNNPSPSLGIDTERPKTIRSLKGEVFGRECIDFFVMLEFIFLFSLPFLVYYSRVFKTALNIPFGQALGLPVIFFVSFLILLLPSFCHGGLFSAGCKIYSLTKRPQNAIGRIYATETIGTILGGIILTYLFIPRLDSFKTIFIVMVLNLFACFLLTRYAENKRLKYLVLISIILVFCSSILGGFNYLDKASINKQYRGLEVLHWQNSVYGNVAVTKQAEQTVFFYNGIPLITTPYPDITSMEEFGHIPLLFHKNPKKILIASAGAGGLIKEILKHSVSGVDYVELDPLIIQMLKKYPSDITNSELKDSRVEIINTDTRLFFKNTSRKYDVILLGIDDPSDLSTNRLFTQEFFSLAKAHLDNDGILAFRLVGSLTYLSRELKNINICILNALRSAFSYVRVIPGDYNMFLASDSGSITESDSILISQRLSQQAIKTNILVPGYLNYRLDKKWQDWFARSTLKATEKINKDLAPFAVFATLVFYNKQFNSRLASFLTALGEVNLPKIGLIIILLTVLLFYLFKRRKNPAKLSIAYSIATTGFFGMLASLIFIFCFQIFYGYVYQAIGILISIFMAGVAAGSIIMSKRAHDIKNDLVTFARLEFLLVVFSMILLLVISTWSVWHISLFFIAGLFVGLEFPLANKIFLKDKNEIGAQVGLLYLWDLLGGWIAGILGGVLLLPVIGVFNTCILIAMLKASSLLMVVYFAYFPRK